MSQITCPKCNSVNWRCWEEHTEWFQDAETDILYEAPVGFLACNDCGHAFAHHDETPNIWLGTYEDVFGSEDE